MQFILGVLIATVAVVGSVIHLQQDLETYIDMVAVFVVFGGTFAVGVITLPFEYIGDLGRAFQMLFKPRHQSAMEVARECLSLCKQPIARIDPEKVPLQGLAGEILRDGIELVWLGYPPDRIQEILGERMHQTQERGLNVANSLRSLSKYPPAFGLVGTVLGLVSLMRAVSVGASPQETGTRMAVALVATLYGLLTANLLISPAGENLVRVTHEERRKAEISLQTLLLLIHRASLLESQERINSFLPPEQRLNLVGSQTAGTSGARAAGKPRVAA
jgi:chemotaxis protein MotA